MLKDFIYKKDLNICPLRRPKVDSRAPFNTEMKSNLKEKGAKACEVDC
jgi:hypothetical protein